MTIRLDGIWMVRRRLQGGAEKFLQGISWGKPDRCLDISSGCFGFRLRLVREQDHWLAV
jgi:hypothetical protein